MKIFSLCLLGLLVSLGVYAQELDPSAKPKSTKQIGFTASWLGGQPGNFGINNIRHPGKAVSLNWGLNSFTGKRQKGKIGLNVQLEYARAEADFERLEGGFLIYQIADTLQDVRAGHLDYSSLSLLVPLYYRYYFGKKLFGSLNLGIRLALHDDIEFAFTEFDYVLSKDEILNLKEEEIEKVDQRFTNSNMSIGFGLSFEKAEIELKIGNRLTNFNHHYFNSEYRLEISITGMYKL